MRTTMDRSNPWAWGHQIWWGSQGGKRKERGWAKKHQGKVREVSKYVQVFCALFFCNERFKTWRLMDCQDVFYRAREKLGNRGWVQKAPVGVQQALTEACWTTCQASWGVFTLLHLHTDFAMPFKIKLFLTKHSESQWSWILTYLPLKCCPPTPYATVGDCLKTWCI